MFLAMSNFSPPLGKTVFPLSPLRGGVEVNTLQTRDYVLVTNSTFPDRE